jgi:hypothetical protein
MEGVMFIKLPGEAKRVVIKDTHVCLAKVVDKIYGQCAVLATSSDAWRFEVSFLLAPAKGKNR